MPDSTWEAWLKALLGITDSLVTRKPPNDLFSLMNELGPFTLQVHSSFVHIVHITKPKNKQLQEILWEQVRVTKYLNLISVSELYHIRFVLFVKLAESFYFILDF
jgi:hypothetical protein